MTKNNSKDLTVGSPTGLILGFSLPLLLGMLFQQVYSLMDTIIVGRFLSVSALAAVGSTGSICFLIIGFCQGVCAGFSLPIAQRFGAKDEKGLKKYVGNAGIVSVIIAIIMTALTVLLCGHILTWMKYARRHLRPRLPVSDCHICRHSCHNTVQSAVRISEISRQLGHTCYFPYNRGSSKYRS